MLDQRGGIGKAQILRLELAFRHVFGGQRQPRFDQGPRGRLAERDGLAFEIGEGVDAGAGDDMHGFGIERGDGAEIADRAGLGEQRRAIGRRRCDAAAILGRLDDAGDARGQLAVIGPGGDIGLHEGGFELARADRDDILDRALGRLRHRDQAVDAATAAALAGARAGRLADRVGDLGADLEIGAGGRRRADAEEVRRVVGPRRLRRKQAGADQYSAAH